MPAVRARSVQELLQLAGLLACVALATSRIGLLAHELVGHGGVALAAGAKVTEVRLFWFAGGWIRYQGVTSTAALLAIAMAGIAVELIAGVVLWWAVRGESLGRRIVRGVGAGLVVHAAWYVATGAWHGFGDGLVLYRVLGDARHAVAIGAGALACAAAYAGGREVLGALAATQSRHRIAGTIAALALAAGCHVALAAGELYVRRDPTYGQVMQPERERVIARDLAQWAHDQDERGVAIDERARASELERLARVHRTFPFAWVLAGAIAIAVVAAATRARPGLPGPPSRQLVAITAVVALGATAVVIVLGAVV